jgi:hypothetical protein
MSTALVESEPEPAVRRGPPDSPLAILQAALERGTDPDKLEKLMDLADRWKSDRAAEAFAAAMNEVQRVIPCVVKDRDNPFTKSRYATLENVNTAIRPVYARHGFSLSYGTDDSKLADHMRVVCDVSHVGGCTRRYHLDCPVDGAGMKGGANKSGAQAMGSTITYARRYLMLMIFNVTVADQDLDGNATDALDAITEAEALEVEDLLADTKANRVKFLEWCSTAGHLIPGERLVANIRAKSLAAVLAILNPKKGPGGQ